MMKFPYEVQIRVNGKSVREYEHRDGKIYIEGRKGTDFTLFVSNNSSERVLAVPTIDGLSVLNGEEADYNAGGYIINPWDHVSIPGWRLDNETVAKFFFSDKKKSYAAKIKKGGNQGIIGVAFFKEKKIEPIVIDYPKEWKLISRWPNTPRYGFSLDPINDPTNSIQCSAKYSNDGAFNQKSIQSDQPETAMFASSLGTGFGKAVQHSVVTSSFEKSCSTPQTIIEFHYGERNDLKRARVFENEVKQITPSSFPKEEKYCKPPKGWVK